MEIEHIRKELNELLENIQEHSNRYSDERPIPSLDISFIQKKINRLQEKMAVLKHLIERKENEFKQRKIPELETTVSAIESQEEIMIEEDEEKIEAPQLSTTKSPPIAKLVDALTLNDRYLYANELFDKDMNAFNELVKSIDNCSSLDEALTLLFSKTLEEENEHVISFQNLVERRFS